MEENTKTRYYETTDNYAFGIASIVGNGDIV